MSKWRKFSTDGVDDAGTEDDGWQKQTVLCSELYKQGILSEELYKADCEITSKRYSDTLMYTGYLIFAYWPLWLLRKRKKFAKKYMHHWILAMSEYYASIQDKDKKTKNKNYIGYLVVLFGLTVVAPHGLLTKISKNKNYRLMLSTLIFIIWFWPVFIFSIVSKFIKNRRR